MSIAAHQPDYHAELRAFLAKLRSIASSQHLTRPLAFLIRTAQDIHADAIAQRETERRATYGQLMLAETELKQLATELEHSPRNATAAQTTAAIGSILERIYAAKGILAALVILGIVHAEVSPFVDDPERRRDTRVLRVHRGRGKEEAC